MEIKFEHTIDLENIKCMSVHIFFNYILMSQSLIGPYVKINKNKFFSKSRLH
jgi:hypothetical protein